MVVAFIVDEGGAAVKRIWREGKSIRLESSNPLHEPKTFTKEDEAIIQGKVIGVVRWHIKRARRRAVGPSL
jgi:SOS-response transcriptional repressor LexA